MEFQEFDKIARFFRDITITEKIDGTHGAIGITTDLSVIPGDPETVTSPSSYTFEPTKSCDMQSRQFDGTFAIASWTDPETGEAMPVVVYAQSRSRLIYPGMDNHGFARWVWENKQALVDVLGPGLHFGEWWGSGIQRGYGLPKGEKRFSLFNTKRWGWMNDPTVCGPFALMPAGLGCVPVLYQGENSTLAVRICLSQLEEFGSVAAPGFKPAEGVVIFHNAGRVMFKATIKNDEVPKSVAAKIQPASFGLAA